MLLVGVAHVPLIYYYSINSSTSSSATDRYALSSSTTRIRKEQLSPPHLQTLSSTQFLLDLTAPLEPVLNTTTTPTNNNQPGCLAWRGALSPQQVRDHLLTTTYTPTGIVMTLVLGQSSLDFLCRFFPSQWQLVIQPQGWDVLLVLGYMDNDNDRKRSKQKEQLISCLALQETQPPRQQTWINQLNNNSTVTTREYHIDHTNNNVTTTTHSNSRIFLTEMALAVPLAALQNNGKLPPMYPRQCQAPKAYVLGTRWYVYEMLHLSILQEYDYFIKLDTDVVFLQPIPLHLLHDMTIRRAIWAHFGAYPPHIQAPCGTGIVAAVQDFLQTTTSTNQPRQLCSSHNTQLFQKDADLYYTNFVIGRTDFFTSPPILQFSRALSAPNGFFRYRWTDQIVWHFAMGLLVADNFQKAVVDYSEFRCTPRNHCWMSVHYYNHDRCDNGGVFFHTKASNSSSPWTWNEHYVVQKDSVVLGRSAVPYETQYVDQCKQMPL
ncbi:expressed unknown protein [Seminavis robusta]|uniref:Nucleotide-diphospho-sugar transferase domain-containing protein n=1 Tax=Seminavis robusta TaxID=568900 RepID=A0A9N8H3T2_9STRA|nr:expressed unknown protein [Seminavis robusta]|eukprot:Sro45_g027130.1 n/a (490) ;mRNA; f:121507-122976